MTTLTIIVTLAWALALALLPIWCEESADYQGIVDMGGQQ